MRAGVVRMSGLVLAATVAAALPAAAGQGDPGTPPGTQNDALARVQAQSDADQRAQVNAFSYMLLDAVQRGGQRLAEWAGQIVPNIELAFATNPTVEATPLPDSSVVFEVRVPEILQTSVMLLVRQWPKDGTMPVARGDRVTGTTVIAGDPMGTASPSPNEQYSNFVREELIEALVDSARILPLDDGQWLTIAANAVDVAVTNPLYRNRSRKLILSLKGDDLGAFRRGELTRDEMRSRIVERRW